MSEANSQRHPSHLTLYGLIAIMTTLWSANYIVSKIALREMPSLLVASVRAALAGVLIVPVYVWNRRRMGRADWTRRDVPVLLYLGIFGVTLNSLFFVLGISRTSVAHASVTIALTPMLVFSFAALMGLEKLRRGRLIGMAVALTGVAVLQLAPSNGAHATLLGDVFIFLAALAFALFTVSGKKVSMNFTSVTLNTFAYVAGGLSLLPLAIWELMHNDVSRVSLLAWLSVAYMAIFPSIVCYLIYYYALTYIPASRVSAFSYMQPVLATLMAIPILGERPTAELLAGGALVLLGVFLTERL